jgi:hypothetical protein
MAKPDPDKRSAMEQDGRIEAGAHTLTRARVKEIAQDTDDATEIVCEDWLRLRNEFDALLDGFHVASSLFARLQMGLKPTPAEWKAAAKFHNAATDIGEREENWRRTAAGDEPVKHVRLDDDIGLGPPER